MTLCTFREGIRYEECHAMLQMSSCFKKAYINYLIVQTSEMSCELVESVVKRDKTCNN